ncbi:MAG: LPS assembly lipoprotein LptE [Pseudomonadota bacterium]
MANGLISPDRRRLLLTAALLPLAGCGFQPVYGEGSPASDLLGQVAIATVAGNARTAYFMREQLVRRLGRAPTDPAYNLRAGVEMTTRGAAIAQDNEITRYSVLGNAEWELWRSGTAEPVATGLVESATSYSATESTFATRTAGRDAERRLAVDLAERIVIGVSLAAADLAA